MLMYNMQCWALSLRESPKNPKKLLHSHVNSRLIDW